MKTKHYTSIEQSKRLVKLGLDPETADMLYSPLYKEGKVDSYKDIPFMKEAFNNELPYDFLPCWSLGALLEVMPDEIYPEDFEGDVPFWGFSPELYKVHHSYDGMDLGTSYYMRYTSEDDGDDRVYKEFEKDTPIEATYSMVTWLLENKMI